MCLAQVNTPKRTPQCTPQRGHSLIELLATLSIAVILLGIGAPSLVDFITSSMATRYANDLIADINFARGEAITRGTTVVICKGPTATNCTTGQWENGWKVFVDCNDNRLVTPAGNASRCPGNAAEEVLRVHSALANGWTLRGNSKVANRITFQPDGRTTNNGTLVACKGGVLNTGNQTSSSAVVVNVTGRARVAQDGNGDGIPDGVAGCN